MKQPSLRPVSAASQWTVSSYSSCLCVSSSLVFPLSALGAFGFDVGASEAGGAEGRCCGWRAQLILVLVSLSLLKSGGIKEQFEIYHLIISSLKSADLFRSVQICSGLVWSVQVCSYLFCSGLFRCVQICSDPVVLAGFWWIRC